MTYEQPPLPAKSLREIVGQHEWQQLWCRQEEVLQQQFFGKTLDIQQLFRTLKSIPTEQWRKWNDRGLEPHILPAIDCSMDAPFPGWKERPPQQFWDQGENGQICRKTKTGAVIPDLHYASLLGEVVLVDPRATPRMEFPYSTEGEFEDDQWIGTLLEQLRDQGRIDFNVREFEHRSTRFGVSRTEWENTIQPILQNHLSFPGEVRLERIIEANIIPQLFSHLPRAKDTQHSAFVHLEEYQRGEEKSFVGRPGSVVGTTVEPLSVFSRDGSSPATAFRPFIVVRSLE